MPTRKRLAIAASLLLTPSLLLCATDGTLIEFDAPGAGTASVPACAPDCGTIPLANNDLGEIVGYYTDANIVPHGFLRRPDGGFVSFDAPGAGLGAGLNQGTVAYAINDFGVIAGQYQDPNYVFHAFIRSPEGSFTTFDVPGAGTGANQGSEAFNVNLEGTVAGIYIDAGGVYHGFVRTPDGKTTSIDLGPHVTYVCEETCLNPQGAVVGFYYASQTAHGFLRDREGKITVIDAPGGGTGNFNGTIAASINPEGVISGYVADAKDVLHGFVRAQDGKVTDFDVPQASDTTCTAGNTTAGNGTAAFSINALGVTAGAYWDANNVVHGFSRWPDGSFTTFDAPHAGKGPNDCFTYQQGTRPSTNNLFGEVTGWYVDANNVNHGFLWLPTKGFE